MVSPCCKCSEIMNEATGRHFCGGCGEDIPEFTDAQVEDFATTWNALYPNAPVGEAFAMTLPSRGPIDPDDEWRVRRAEADRLELAGRRQSYWMGWIDGALVAGLLACLFAVLFR